MRQTVWPVMRGGYRKGITGRKSDNDAGVEKNMDLTHIHAVLIFLFQTLIRPVLVRVVVRVEI